MKNMKLVGCLTLVAVVIAGSLSLSSAQAEQKKDKKRAATTKQLMKGIVASNCGALGKALKAENPDWDEITLRAALLNEGGHLLMDDGRCPDGEWAKGAKTVQECSVVILEKADAKDLEGVKEAFGALTTGGCAVCHKAHKGKKKE